MKYGICTLSIIPCRKEPSNKSELTSQLLFGEYYTVIEQTKKWIKIINEKDKYKSWIEINQHNPILEKDFLDFKKEKFIPRVSDFGKIIKLENGNCLPLTIGSLLPKIKNYIFYINKIKYEYPFKKTEKQKITKQQICKNALLYLNAPYMWGGKTFFGIDCSGFSQIIYQLNNINLPRDAYKQATIGNIIASLDKSEPGDLAFFDNNKGEIVHVGIIMDDKKIIHASGKVKIEKINHLGIYNDEENKYSHKLKVLKKII